MEFAKVKIISDGTKQGTRVMVEGKALPVKYVSWRTQQFGDETEATIVLAGVELEVNTNDCQLG